MSTIDSKDPVEETKKGRAQPRSIFGGRGSQVSQTYWAEEQAGFKTDLNLTDRMNLLWQYGNFSMAYSTAVQPCLRYFGDDEGYIAYRKRWGMTFALGDTMCAPDLRSQLIDGFISSQKRVSFCQISRPVAEVLANRGFYVNEMGVDTTLDLPNYSLNGKQKEWLRYAANWTNKRGYQVVESQFKEIDVDRVESVSEAWRKTRTVKRKEVRFLNRPIVMKDENRRAEVFLLSPDSQLLAFVFLDPIYQDNQVCGYVTVFKRRHPDAPLYAEQAIMKHVIETLKNEGVAKLKLGLSPLAGIEEGEFKSNSFTRWSFKKAFDAKWVNRYFYNVVGHAEYKRRFRGEEEKVYFASPTRFNTPRMLALIGLCGIA